MIWYISRYIVVAGFIKLDTELCHIVVRLETWEAVFKVCLEWSEMSVFLQALLWMSCSNKRLLESVWKWTCIDYLRIAMCINTFVLKHGCKRWVCTPVSNRNMYDRKQMCICLLITCVCPVGADQTNQDSWLALARLIQLTAHILVRESPFRQV